MAGGAIALLFFLGQVFGRGLFQVPHLIRIFLSQDERLLSQNTRTNFLVLGIAGGNHDGADLTDTMIFLSADLKTADSMMMNIPRDIWVPDLVTKINTVYFYGEKKGKDEGFKSLNAVFQEFFGQNINYSFLVDFATFKDMIDLIGGIEVVVDQAFDDYHYPIPGKEKDECGGDKEYKCRYEHLHFEQGLTHMDGTQALKYVRSRHAEGEEGTDFARSKRQEKIMLALKNRLLSFEIISSPSKLKAILTTVREHLVIYPEPSVEEQVSLVKLALRFVTKQKTIRLLNLETGDEDNPQFLVNPPLSRYGQWALEPVGGDWTKIQDFIREKIKGGY